VALVETDVDASSNERDGQLSHVSVAWAVWPVETDAVASSNESDGLFADRSMG
jgi:hypothetical protein